MDHGFLTRRDELNATKDCLRLLADITTILTISSADKVCLLRRTDDEISDKAVRDAVCRHSSRLGLLLKDVDRTTHGEMQAKHGAAWAAFVQGSKEVPALSSDLEAVASNLRVNREVLEAIEDDDNSSSYSDYSASSTSSTSSRTSYETDHESGSSG